MGEVGDMTQINSPFSTAKERQEVLDLTNKGGTILQQATGWVRNIFRRSEVDLRAVSAVPGNTGQTFSFRRADGLFVLKSNDPEFVAMMRRYPHAPVVEKGEWVMLITSQALNVPERLQERVQYGAPVPTSSFPVIGSEKTSVGEMHKIPNPFR